MLRLLTPFGEYLQYQTNIIRLTATRKLNRVPSLQAIIPATFKLDRLIDGSAEFDYNNQKSVAIAAGRGEQDVRPIEQVSNSLLTASLFGRSEMFVAVDTLIGSELRESGATELSTTLTNPVVSGQFNGSFEIGDVIPLPPAQTDFAMNSLAILDFMGWYNELWLLKRVLLEESQTTLEYKGLNSLLEDRFVLNTSSISGYADDIIKTLVYDNAGAGAGERGAPRLTVSGEISRGAIVEIVDIRFRPLLDVITDIADLSKEAGKAVYFNITADNGLNLRFNTKVVEVVEAAVVVDVKALRVSGNRDVTDYEFVVL